MTLNQLYNYFRSYQSFFLYTVYKPSMGQLRDPPVVYTSFFATASWKLILTAVEES